MHKCSKCGKEFEGNFCPECGAKWVDPEACPKCGAHCKPNDKFCSMCGARLDGKAICTNCGATIEENALFCVQCGAKQGAGQAHGESAVAVSGKERVNVSFILALCGVIFVLASAFTGLVFTFVSGVSIVSANSGMTLDTNMLYYYFGDVYEEIDSMRYTVENIFDFSNIGEMREYAMYFPAAIGTAVSALGILGVVLLSALTGYKAYKKYYKKQEVSVVAPAAATYLTFAATATMLLALNSAESDGAKMTFSAPTLAGLISGGIFLGIGVLLIAAANYKSFKNYKALISAVLAVVACAFVAVMFGLLALPSGGIKMDSEKVCYGLFDSMWAMLLLIRDDDVMTTISALGSVGGLAGLALAVICVVMLTKKITSVCTGKKKSVLALACVAVALSAAYLTFTILLEYVIADELFGGFDDGIKGVYAVSIALLVFSVFALAVEIADRVVGKKEAHEEA